MREIDTGLDDLHEVVELPFGGLPRPQVTRHPYAGQGNKETVGTPALAVALSLSG